MSLLLASIGGGGTVTYTYTGTGGFTISGSAVLSKSKSPAVSGGIALSGSGGISRSRVYVTAGGGITLAGSASVSKSKTWTSSGGVEFAGTAAIAITHTPPASGGKVFGGSASTSYTPAGGATYTYTPTGGFTLSGNAASELVSAVQSESGGVWIKESKREVKPKSFDHLPRGGIVFGGSAPVSRTRAHRAIIRISPRKLSSHVSRTISRESTAKLSIAGRATCRLHVNPEPQRQRERMAMAARIDGRSIEKLRQSREQEEIAVLLALLK